MVMAWYKSWETKHTWLCCCYRPSCRGCSTNSLVIYWFIDSFFPSKCCCPYDQVAEVEQVSPMALKRCVSAWVGARDTKLGRKVLSYLDFSLICTLNRVLGVKTVAKLLKIFGNFWTMTKRRTFFFWKASLRHIRHFLQLVLWFPGTLMLQLHGC